MSIEHLTLTNQSKTPPRMALGHLQWWEPHWPEKICRRGMGRELWESLSMLIPLCRGASFNELLTIGWQRCDVPHGHVWGVPAWVWISMPT